jgi:hypothetical protein
MENKKIGGLIVLIWFVMFTSFVLGAWIVGINKQLPEITAGALEQICASQK